MSKDSQSSSLREEYIEYALLGDLCREFWRRELLVDILRSHTDQSGFDIVMEVGPLQRHIQIKSSFVGSATKSQKVNRRLEHKAGGCVVWVLFERGNFKIDHYRWFGASEPEAAMPALGSRIARHTKANALGAKAVRPGIRTLNWGEFDRVDTTPELAARLFPPHPASVQPEELLSGKPHDEMPLGGDATGAELL